MKRAFVTGVTGQDGSYLSEFLLGIGYEVHGLIRRSSSFNTGRIEHLMSQFPDTFVLHHGDATDGLRLFSLLHDVQPTEIYNLAAQSHVRVSFDSPFNTVSSVQDPCTIILEFLKTSNSSARMYQASSSEMFGATPPPQSSKSVFRPQSPYAIAKLSAHQMVKNYREGFGLWVCSGILFNHESPRRGRTFVTKKIAEAVARIAEGRQDYLELGNIDAERDWGYAPEYVVAMWSMLQQNEPRDLVIGSGDRITVKDFLEGAAQEAGLGDLSFVRHNERLERPLEVVSLQADTTEAKNLLRWQAELHGKSLAALMTRFELDNLQSKTTQIDRPQTSVWHSHGWQAD